MTKFAVYTRDESSLITFRCVVDDMSVEDYLTYYFRADETPENADLIGWPDNKVTWYRDTGISIR